MMSRCTGYCTAAGYDLQRLMQLPGAKLLFRDVVQVATRGAEAFYFSYGVVIFWGHTQEDERAFLQILKKFERESLDREEVDEFTFIYGDRLRIADDEIVLQDEDVLTKLATSYAVAQSLKLTGFEVMVSRTIEHSKQIPQDLAVKGKIPLSRRETSRKIGELFLERMHVNLHTDILDTPEFFWDNSELEPAYRRMIQYLDVTKRVDLLNRRLTLMHELYEILSSELNHQLSSRLELTIVVLIVIEILLAIAIR